MAQSKCQFSVRTCDTGVNALSKVANSVVLDRFCWDETPFFTSTVSYRSDSLCLLKHKSDDFDTKGNTTAWYNSVEIKLKTSLNRGYH